VIRVFRAKKTSDSLKVVGFVAIVIILIILANAGLANLVRVQEKNQLEVAQDAIMKAAVQCYALESQYPASLRYLVDNYGITLDEEKYVYHYRTIGSNLTPEIKVFPVTTAGGR
jgi:uncharacterized protein (UPF0333 family)